MAGSADYSICVGQFSQVQDIEQLMLENRSFGHMLGFLYPGKTGPNGQPFEGLPGTE